jgi:5S rRNA maturation endonuclease (ribonuclease M5)
MNTARTLDGLSILTIHEALGGTQGKTVAGEVYGTCWGAHQNGTAHDNLRLNEERGTYACHCLGETGGGGKLDLVVFSGKASDPSSASKYLVEIGVLAPPTPSNGVALNGARTPRRTTASFEYQNEDGTPFARVDRVEPGKKGDGKDFYPKLWVGNGYAQSGGLQGQKCPLYGLPALRAGIEAESLIFFCEGEGNVATLTGTFRKFDVKAVATTIQGGTPAKMTDEHFEQLRGAQGVVVLLDADSKGREAGKLRARQIASKTGANVRTLDLYPDRTDGSDIVDWLREGNTVEALLDLVAQAPTIDVSTAPASPSEQQVSASDDGKPAIYAGEGDLTVIAALAVDALLAQNRDAHLVRYAGAICRLEHDENGVLTPVRMTTLHMRDELADAAHWYRLKKAKPEGLEEAKTVPVPAFPPNPVCDNILVRTVKPFPVLAAIVDVPIIAPDGTLQSNQGYNPKTRTYFDPAPGMADLTIPTNPTEDEIAQACELLLGELMGDFPFASDSDKANAVGAILTPFMQYADIFPVPAATFEAPVQASGKTLLAKLTLGIGSGKRLRETGMTKEEETQKTITTALLSNWGTLLIDNIEGKYGSPILHMALSSTTYSARLLGGNEPISVPWRLILVFTANNALFSADLVRRSYRIRLDPGMERPQDREVFRHKNLEKWCQQNRPRLAAAALTLIMAWVAAGKPDGTAVKGTFQEWATIIGGILNLVGIPGFLENDRQFSETADRDGDEMRLFVASWYAAHKESEVPTKELMDLEAAGDLSLGDGSEPARRKKLGMLLSRYRDRVFNVGEGGNDLSICLKFAGTTGGRARWKTVKAESLQETKQLRLGGQVDRGGQFPLPHNAKKSTFSKSSIFTYYQDGEVAETSTPVHLSTYPNALGSTANPEEAVAKEREAHETEQETHGVDPDLDSNDEISI